MLRADLHIHTCYSMDCSTSLEALFRRCQQRGVTCIAITDHGTCAGGLRAREIAPFQVIVRVMMNIFTHLVMDIRVGNFV